MQCNGYFSPQLELLEKCRSVGFEASCGGGLDRFSLNALFAAEDSPKLRREIESSFA